jgi:predicted solute-binding protein
MIRLVYSSPLICEPLLAAINHEGLLDGFKIEKIPELDCLTRLETGETDLALLTPLGYAKSKGEILLVEDVMIHSPIAGKNVLLFFKGDLKNFKTVYCQDFKKENHYERFLAEMVLQEYFELDITWKQLPADSLTNSLLDQLQVILLTGEPAFEFVNQIDTFIDLSEEWCLRTDLPLVQNMLCVHSSFQYPEQLQKIRHSLQLGLTDLRSIAENYARTHSQGWEFYHRLLSENYQYSSNPVNLESLQQLFQYMFYSGVVDYLPQIKLFEN